MKYLINLLLLLNALVLFGQNTSLQKVRNQYKNFNTISYTSTAYYPNPDTDDLSIFKVDYTLYNILNNRYDFYSKSEDNEEIFHNNIYTRIDHSQKALYQYENLENQVEEMQSSRLSLYGPISLLQHDWKYVNDIKMDGKTHSHFSFIESLSKFENKTIKVEYHIYISKDHTINQFERKSYVDNVLGQTITYKFSNYKFSNAQQEPEFILPKNYTLKYFERIEYLQPLKENTEAPLFEATDIQGNSIILNQLKTPKLILFSSTNCGYSKMIHDYISSESFDLSNDLRLINIYGSDSKAQLKNYTKSNRKNYTTITGRKDIEKEYGISGYPTLYLIDPSGIILKTVDGADQILPYLQSINTYKD